MPDAAAVAGKPGLLDLPESAVALRAGEARRAAKRRIGGGRPGEVGMGPLQLSVEIVRTSRPLPHRAGPCGRAPTGEPPISPTGTTQSGWSPATALRGMPGKSASAGCWTMAETSAGADRPQPGRPVVARAGEDDAHDPPPVARGGGAEQRVDRRAVAVLLRAVGDPDDTGTRRSGDGRARRHRPGPVRSARRRRGVRPASFVRRSRMRGRAVPLWARCGAR